MTKHANNRVQQRGIKHKIIELILEFADKINHSSNGSHSYIISRKHLNHLVACRAISSQEAERARGVVVIEGSGVVVTTFHKKQRHFTKKLKARR